MVFQAIFNFVVAIFGIISAIFNVIPAIVRAIFNFVFVEILYPIFNFVYSVVNAIVKPIVVILTLPFTIVTLGLFIFVINGLMLLLTSSLSGGRLVVEGLGTAILGGIVMGIAAMIVEALLKAVGLEEDRPRRERRRDAPGR